MNKYIVYALLSVASLADAQTSTQIDPARIGWTLNPTTSVTAGSVTATTGSFTSITDSGLSTAGYITNNAAGLLGTVATIPLAGLAAQTSNTVLGNATSASASPTALAMTSCSAGSSAVSWTTNTGFGCNTAINASLLGGSSAAAFVALSSAQTITGVKTFSATPIISTLTGYVYANGSSALTASATIPNTGLANSSVTIGTTAIGLGSSSTTLSGLTSVTSTSFTGALSGNASTATSATTATNLAGGAVGSEPYQSAAATTAFLASPTTSGHTFVHAWQPSGSAIAPVALDLATYLASPPAIGGTTPASGAFTSLTVSGTPTFTGIEGSTTGCVQVSSAGVLSNTGSACVSSSSSVVGIVGGFRTLKLSTTGTSVNITITATEIVLESSTNNYVTVRSVSVSPTTTASGANGLDTGTIASSTWYSVWVIYNGSTVAGLLSASATSPTLPSGYTYYARVGWIKTDSSGYYYPLSFTQYGRTVRYLVNGSGNVATLPTIASGTTSSAWTAVSMSSYVPSTASSVTVQLYSYYSGAAWASPSSAYTASNGNAAVLNVQVQSTGQYQYALGAIQFEAYPYIYYASSSSYASMWCYGWEDNL
jgi:hypothetical protein